jgi:hypothetical protein
MPSALIREELRLIHAYSCYISWRITGWVHGENSFTRNTVIIVIKISIYFIKLNVSLPYLTQLAIIHNSRPEEHKILASVRVMSCHIHTRSQIYDSITHTYPRYFGVNIKWRDILSLREKGSRPLPTKSFAVNEDNYSIFFLELSTKTHTETQKA